MNTETRAVSAQAEAIIEAARNLFGLSGSSWEQFRRYATEHLRWCEERGIELPADDAARARYREHLEATGKLTRPRHWTLRATAINKLSPALTELRRCARATTSARRTRLLDALPIGSRGREAVDAVLEGTSGSYRASLRADLAVFLEWCEVHSRPVEEIQLSDLAAFERWVTRGRRSRGPWFAAKRLYGRLREPEAWWR